MPPYVPLGAGKDFDFELIWKIMLMMVKIIIWMMLGGS